MRDHQHFDEPLRLGLTLGAMTGGGIARYSMELASALLVRPEIVVIPIGTREAIEAFVSRVGPQGRAYGKIVISTSTQMGEALFVRKTLGRRAIDARLDLLHGTKHLLPSRIGIPTVLTVHDLTAIERRSDFPLKKRLLLPALYSSAIRNADTLVAVSAAVADRLRKRYPERSERVVAVPHAMPRAGLPKSNEPIARLEGRKFALTVGDMSPRKNLGLLLEIWPTVFARTGQVLAFAGTDGWKSKRVLSELEKLEVQGIAVKLGRVSDEQLRWLYKTASVCCVPSLEEGFGFPVVEALGHGCPVVASTDAALVEAGRGHSLHVPPHDALGWIAVITAVMASGRREATSFDRGWNEVAEEMIVCYLKTALAPACPLR